MTGEEPLDEVAPSIKSMTLPPPCVGHNYAALGKVAPAHHVTERVIVIAIDLPVVHDCVNRSSMGTAAYYRSANAS